MRVQRATDLPNEITDDVLVRELAIDDLDELAVDLATEAFITEEPLRKIGQLPGIPEHDAMERREVMRRALADEVQRNVTAEHGAAAEQRLVGALVRKATGDRLEGERRAAVRSPQRLPMFNGAGGIPAEHRVARPAAAVELEDTSGPSSPLGGPPQRLATIEDVVEPVGKVVGEVFDRRLVKVYAQIAGKPFDDRPG